MLINRSDFAFASLLRATVLQLLETLKSLLKIVWDLYTLLSGCFKLTDDRSLLEASVFPILAHK